MFVLQLMVHKWDARAPHPAYKTIAQRMGVSTVYARRLGQKLQHKGYLNRRMRVGKTTRFDLQPFFDCLAQHVAAEATRTRKRVDEDE